MRRVLTAGIALAAMSDGGSQSRRIVYGGFHLCYSAGLRCLRILKLARNYMNAERESKASKPADAVARRV